MAVTLFDPGRIGPIEVPNRIIMAPMTTRCADGEGFVTPQTIAYYGARARGGVGLVTVEMASPEKCGRHRKNELGLYDDRFLPGLHELAHAIRAVGSRAGIQIGHGGGHTRSDICGETPIAPSAIPHVVQEITTETIVPEAMTEQRVQQTIEAHVAAARRAASAGFECIEVHAAHGYLISQFHTPFENRRTDRWGGSLENRARFGLEITRRIKAALPRLALVYRLTVDDFFPQGLPLADGLQIAEWAATAGADAIHVSAGHYRSLPGSLGMIPPMARPEASFLAFARALKARVGVPVIAVGRLGDPKLAAAALADGDCDFVALGRPLLADERWVAKVRAGQPVRHCLACNTCVNVMREGSRLQCLVNTRTGREVEFGADVSPDLRGRRIAVVGAGPAGLTFAGLAAKYSEVVVFERTRRPGGALRQAAQAPRFQDVEAAPASFDRYVASLVQICESRGVRIEYGVDAAKVPERLRDFDVIVVATGASYRRGLSLIASTLLRSGVLNLPAGRRVFDAPTFRDWLYYKARRGTGRPVAALARPGQTVIVIGDAASPGKSQSAVAQAFEAALLGRHVLMGAGSTQIDGR